MDCQREKALLIVFYRRCNPGRFRSWIERWLGAMVLVGSLTSG